MIKYSSGSKGGKMERHSVVIDLPQKIENNFDGYNFFARLYQQLQGHKDKEVIFCFKKTRWFEANLTSVFAVIIEMLQKNNCQVTIGKVTNSVESIFLKNGFYDFFGLGK